MIKYFIFIIIIILVINYSYIRCFFKRLVCFRKVRKICDRKGFKIYKTHFLWFLGSRYMVKCDCYIETPNELFAVKMFGVDKRSSTLIFNENGQYYIQRFISFVSNGSMIRLPINCKSHTMPKYNFRYKYKNEWEIKTPHKILLVNPVAMEFRRQMQNGSEEMLDAGDIINDMEIYSLPRFLGTLGNAL